MMSKCPFLPLHSHQHVSMAWPLTKEHIGASAEEGGWRGFQGNSQASGTFQEGDPWPLHMPHPAHQLTLPHPNSELDLFFQAKE